MGAYFRFACPKCGYEVEACGGRDEGGLVAVQTVSCRECKALYDAVIRRLDDPKPRTVRPACPENPKHRVTRWGDCGPCPRCGEQMPPGTPRGIWD